MGKPSTHTGSHKKISLTYLYMDSIEAIGLLDQVRLNKHPDIRVTPWQRFKIKFFMSPLGRLFTPKRYHQLHLVKWILKQDKRNDSVVSFISTSTPESSADSFENFF